MIEFLKQRSSVGKISVQAVDRLLIDFPQLQQHKELNLSKEDQDAIWLELLEAFRMNDAIHLLDCLDYGGVCQSY